MAVIFKFASSGTRGLCAFAGDADGTKLPERHGPWIADGTVAKGQRVPHEMDRAAIERAIGEHGYQMWRMRKPDAAAATVESAPRKRSRAR